MYTSAVSHRFSIHDKNFLIELYIIVLVAVFNITQIPSELRNSNPSQPFGYIIQLFDIDLRTSLIYSEFSENVRDAIYVQIPIYQESGT